jgi:hypothetical protein
MGKISNAIDFITTIVCKVSANYVPVKGLFCFLYDYRCFGTILVLNRQ